MEIILSYFQLKCWTPKFWGFIGDGIFLFVFVMCGCTFVVVFNRTLNSIGPKTVPSGTPPLITKDFPSKPSPPHFRDPLLDERALSRGSQVINRVKQVGCAVLSKSIGIMPTVVSNYLGAYTSVLDRVRGFILLLWHEHLFAVRSNAIGLMKGMRRFWCGWDWVCKL